MTTSARMHALSPPNCGWTRIPILPIRYAVVPRDTESGSTRYADSGYALDTAFPALKRSVYTLRALRPGYVYVFMKGPEGERLVIHEHDGEGHFKELKYQGLECYHRRDCFVSTRSLGWVWVEHDEARAAEIWIGYSSHLWTNAMTARLCASQAMRSRHMRRLDLVELLSGESSPSTQPHVLPADALAQWVEDYKPAGQRMPLFWSCHESSPDLTPYTFLSLRTHYPCLTPRVPAVVALNDAEGIGLDLGLSVSAYQHQVRDLMPTPVHMRFDDPSQSTHDAVPSCFYKTSGVLSADSQDYHRKDMIAFLIEQTLESLYEQKRTPAGLMTGERYRSKRRSDDRYYQGSPSQQRYEKLTDPRASPQGARLAERLDVEKYRAFLGQRDRMQSKRMELQAIALEATHDHDVWLASAEVGSLENNRSLAAALATYDRDNRDSATSLETLLALLIHPMSQTLPGTEDEDPRFKRLERWLDHEDSPLYVALAPFNPFRDRADAVATLLSANAGVIEGIGGQFPALAGTTDLTAESVSTVVLKRMRGQTRWNASHTLHQQLLAAANDTNAVKALGLLVARYEITDTYIKSDTFSSEIKRFIEAGMAEVKKTTSLHIQGSRTVTLQETTTLKVKPTRRLVAKSGSLSALNIGALWFNMINLKAAYHNAVAVGGIEHTTSFASALFATSGSISASIASGYSLNEILRLRKDLLIKQGGFAKSTVKLITSKIYTRALGYPAILLGLASDLSRAARQRRNGDSIAALYSFGGGIAFALGNGLVLEGGLAALGLTTLASTAGLIVSSVILVGAAFITVGLILISKSNDRTHTPIELWIARSIFGNKLNDGEVREDIRLTYDKKLPDYKSLSEELISWHAIYHAPLLLEKIEITCVARTIETAWHDAIPITPLGTSVPYSKTFYSKPSVAEFTILLRGFILGESKWEANAEGIHERKATTETVIYNVEAFETAQGLILNFKCRAIDLKEVSLHVHYTPSHPLTSSESIHRTFTLGKYPW